MRRFDYLIFALFLGLLSFASLEAQAVENSLTGKACSLAKILDPHLPCDKAAITSPETITDREALWSVIHTICIPAAAIGFNYPCLRVDNKDGYVVIRTPDKEKIDFLIAPTRKMAGVESPDLLKGDAPNLWAAGWKERALVAEVARKKLSWNDYALAVNSRQTRSQDQLHIHLGCVDRNLKRYFAVHKEYRPANNWVIIRLSNINSDLLMKALPADGLSQNLFAKISSEAPWARLFIDKQTVALIAIEDKSFKGFVLLVSLDRVSAESFLAKSC